MHKSSNYLQYVIYKLARKVSLFFSFLKLHPNHISVLSFILCFLSCYFLLRKNDITAFTIIWLFSHFLDYCDGTLARITNKKTKILLRVDHTLDLIKFSFVVFSISSFYGNEIIYAVVSYSIIFSLLMKEIFDLNVKIDRIRREHFQNNFHKNYVVRTSIKKNKLLNNLYNILFTFNGHTLFFLPLALNNEYGIYMLIYILLLLLKCSINPLMYLIFNDRLSND